MVDTLWLGAEADKLYLQQGQLTSTLLDSEDVSSFESLMSGISYDGSNTLWCGWSGNKLYKHQGILTSTLLDSEDVVSIDTFVSGISYDGTDTPWCGRTANKFYKQQGTFTSTLLDSLSAAGAAAIITGISFDGNGNTPIVDADNNNLVLTQGQFSTVVLDSEAVSSGSPADISFDSVNTSYCTTSGALFILQGQFTSTILDSENVSSIDNQGYGICPTTTDRWLVAPPGSEVDPDTVMRRKFNRGFHQGFCEGFN